MGKRYEIHFCKNRVHTIEHHENKRLKNKALVEYFSSGNGLFYARDRYAEYVLSCRNIEQRPLPLKRYIVKLAKSFPYGKVFDTYIYVFEREKK